MQLITLNQTIPIPYLAITKLQIETINTTHVINHALKNFTL